MTIAQKNAKAKFKQAIAYRTKTGVTLKEAFAHIYGRKVGAVKKKAVKKIVKKKIAKKVIRKVVKKVAKKKLTKKDYDKRYQAKKPGKRTSSSGNTYYENRPNRSDRGKLLGIEKSSWSLMTDLNGTLQKMHDTQSRINIYTNAIKNKNTSRYDKININQELKNCKIYLTELKTHFRELKKML